MRTTVDTVCVVTDHRVFTVIGTAWAAFAGFPPNAMPSGCAVFGADLDRDQLAVALDHHSCGGGGQAAVDLRAGTTVSVDLVANRVFRAADAVDRHHLVARPKDVCRGGSRTDLRDGRGGHGLAAR